jgi:hypothetical protein
MTILDGAELIPPGHVVRPGSAPIARVILP